MAFRTNKLQQLTLMDSHNTMSERNKNFMKKSWANGFSNIVFPNINEERFSILYSDNEATRPNTPVNIIVGALIIKEMFGQSDEELLESILFDVRYQYALHTTSFDEQPLSDRTFSRFRERVLQYEKETGIDLLKHEMYSLAESYCKYLEINPSVKRMDSVMIAANCKVMSRLELFYACVAAMVELIHSTGEHSLLEGFERYLRAGDKNDTIYRCKPEEAKPRLEKAASDAVALAAIAGDGYGESTEYHNLKKLIDEQVIVEEAQVQLKNPQDIPANSLQNPFDPDATYRTKAGKKHTGYVGNLVETVDEKGSMITQYDYKPNVYADHSFGKDVIDELGKQSNKVILIADGAYSGMDNVELAQDNGIELITTALTGSAPSDIHSGFVIDKEKHVIVRCPAGFKPEYFKHNLKRDDYRITFKKEHCENCHNRDKCKAVLQKKNAVVKISQNMIDRAKYLEYYAKPEYEKLKRKRNGVEGLPSILRRKHRVDDIPVRGLLRSKLWFSFKIGAINVRKLLKAMADTGMATIISCFVPIFSFFTLPWSAKTIQIRSF